MLVLRFSFISFLSILGSFTRGLRSVDLVMIGECDVHFGSSSKNSSKSSNDDAPVISDIGEDGLSV